MNSLYLLILLQLRIKRNLTFGRRYAQMWLIILISFLIILFVVGSSNLIYTLTTLFKESVSKDPLSFLSKVLASLMFTTFLYAFIFRIHFDLSDGYDIPYLPVNKIHSALSDIFFHFFDFWTLLITVVFYSIIIPLEMYSDFFQYFLAGVIFTVYLLGVYLTVRFFVAMIEYIIKWYGHHGSNLTAGTNFILIVIMSLFVLVIYVNHKPDSLADLFSRTWTAYLPSGLAAAALTGLTGTNSYWLLYLFGLSGYLLILFLLVFFLSTKKVGTRRLYRVSKKSAARVSRLQQKDTLIRVLISKEILYLIRSTRIKLMLFFGVFFTFLYLNTNLFSSDGFCYLNLVILNAGALYLTFEAISNWLHEQKGVRFYFYSSLNLKILILTKNLAFFFWIAVIETINLACGFLVKPALMRFDSIIFAPIFLVGFYWLMIIPLNYFAFKWPKKVSYHSFFSKSMSAYTVPVFILPVFFLSFYFYIPFFFDPIITKLLLCLMALLSVVIYYLSLNFIQRQMFQCRDQYMETIC